MLDDHTHYCASDTIKQCNKAALIFLHVSFYIFISCRLLLLNMTLLWLYRVNLLCVDWLMYFCLKNIGAKYSLYTFCPILVCAFRATKIFNYFMSE